MDSPGVQLTGIGGNFGIKKWTPMGKANVNSSSFFKETPMLSQFSSHTSGKASLGLGLTKFKILSRNLGRGGSFEIGVKSTALFKLQYNNRKGFFSTSNTIKIN